LGTLYAWQQAQLKAQERFGVDLLGQLRAGAAVGMYHTAGLGTRLAPLPGSEGNNKPGVKLPGLMQVGERQEAMTVLEGVIRQTSIYSTGRGGRLSVFWGDQLFVPSRRPPARATHHADILCRLGGMPDEAAWKVRGLDRYGLLAVNSRGDAAQLERMGPWSASVAGLASAWDPSACPMRYSPGW
jgi:hypothetical protein